MKIDLTEDEAAMLRWLLDGLEFQGEPFKNFEDDTGRNDLDPDKLIESIMKKIAEPAP